MRFSAVLAVAFLAAPILAAPTPSHKITNTTPDALAFNGMIDELQLEK